MFNTLGMSELRMPGADYLTELNLGYRGVLSKEDEFRMAAFLANITEYPSLETPDEAIKLLYVIPLTPRENHILAEHGRDTFLAYVEHEGVDRFSARVDAAGG